MVAAEYETGSLLPPEPGFDRFIGAMARIHLRRMQRPVEPVYTPLAWISHNRPEWRWNLAHYLLFQRAKRTSKFADESVHAARDLLSLRLEDQPPGPAYIPPIDAVLIYERDQRDRWLLEAHLLVTDLPPNLSAKLGLSPETVDYYASWFFDVRGQIGSSPWITHYALGDHPINGFADADLAPVWKRIAYFCGERKLDIAVAVTTGIGLDRYSESERDGVQLLIEQLRLSLIRQPERVFQFERRQQAEAAGEHPSCYHMPRRRKPKSESRHADERDESRPEFSLLDSIGERRRG
jgi:hypothetical protein